MGRDLASVICTYFCFQPSVPRWCNWVRASYSSNQVTQCCSILPADAVSRLDWLGFYGEQSDTFKALDLICRLLRGLKPGQWFCFLGVKTAFTEKRVASEPSHRLPQDLRDVANAPSSLQEHALLLGFNFFSSKQRCMGAKSPRS